MIKPPFGEPFWRRWGQTILVANFLIVGLAFIASFVFKAF